MQGGRQTEYRVIVTGLPPSASWQDLKDHMRKAGDVVYTDVDHRGGGIVHYGTRYTLLHMLNSVSFSPLVLRHRMLVFSCSTSSHRAVYCLYSRLPVVYSAISRDDMDYALRKLDESEFRNPFDKSYIRVLPHRGARRDSRSRSRSRTPPR